MWHLYGLLVFELLVMLPSDAKGAYVDQELINLASRIWDADPHRLQVGKDLKLDWQGIVGEKDAGRDVAPKPLFSVNTQRFKNNPVVDSFIALLDNYEHRIGFSEVETLEEKAEIQRFLDAVLRTPTMRSFHTYLWNLKLASPKLSEFKKELHDIWFKPYKRVRSGDSSPFEHVFVGETKQKNVIGMHNWITFYLNEKEGIIDYYGYGRPKSEDPDFKRTLRFGMYDTFEKPHSTILFGSSVEFEFGLYTTVFLKARELFKNKQDWPPFLLNLEGKQVLVQCHGKNKNRMGSCYFK
ncbi:Poly(U)-specific endoribonuclease [Echinococcus granulosus]|nr:Poly(U)-specific endoribonuclease [Echinococcus granulosus]